jgi:hypothetical protein
LVGGTLSGDGDYAGMLRIGAPLRPERGVGCDGNLRATASSGIRSAVIGASATGETDQKGCSEDEIAETVTHFVITP